MIRLLFLFSMGLVLMSCAHRPSGPAQSVDLPAQLAHLTTVTQWQAKGKMALKDIDNGLSASMNWQVDEQDFRFRLTNMLGITLVNMRQTGNEVTLVADDKSYRDSNADRLLYETTGWFIPVTALINWTKGLPSPKDDFTLNDSGLVKTLHPMCSSCQEWKIDYDRYTQVEGVWLPTSITMTHKYIDNRWIKIRVSSWTLPSTAAK